MNRKPARTSLSVLYQVCNLIPTYLVPVLAREFGVNRKARSFSAWSHVVALLYAQLAHSLSLGDVCDALKNHAAKLLRIRNATVPSKNALSHANRNRDSQMAEALFWKVLASLFKLNPRFYSNKTFKLPRRFKRAIYAADSTTISLVVNCIDWARHRRRKAAAKIHVCLNLHNLLPSMAIVDTASQSDPIRARELCAGLKPGEIVVFDKAYIDFAHLHDLEQREVFFVTRPKENMKFRVAKRNIKKPEGNILRDDLIVLKCPASRGKYPGQLRRIVALVEVDGQIREMEFLTNNLEWAPSSIGDLYKCRWQIEAFFKEIKQTLQLGDFLGYNKNAVLWQVWTALTAYILLRFLAFCNEWQYGFKRFYCLVRSSLWESWRITSLIAACGTAGVSPPRQLQVYQPYFPGFNRLLADTCLASHSCHGTAQG